MQHADDHRLEPEHAHWPLIAMLVLTQLSVGGFAVELGALAAGSTGGLAAVLQAICCLGFGWAGLAASVAHLGRPLFANRALYRSAAFLAQSRGARLRALRPARCGLCGAGCARSGLVCNGVGCASGLARVGRPGRIGGPGVFGDGVPRSAATVLASVGRRGQVRGHCRRARAGHRSGGLGHRLTGSSGHAARGDLLVADHDGRPEPDRRCIRQTVVRGEARPQFRPIGTVSILRATALLLGGPLERPAGLRRLLGVVGGVVLPALAVMGVVTANPRASATAAVLALAASIAGETAERYLFFTAVVKPKMPGGLMP